MALAKMAPTLSASTLLSSDDLAAIEEQAAALGVELELSFDASDGNLAIWLGRIERTTGRPGAGSDVLDILCELADEVDCPIRAAVIEWHQMLLDYYAAKGFQIDPSRPSQHGYVVIERH